jgi:hypothetical protein
LSKICAANPAILAFYGEENQTDCPASKAVSAQALPEFAIPLAPEFLGTLRTA